LKLAVTDIGSNAIRFHVARYTEHDNQIYTKRLEHIRFPLRLGKDVFSKGKITRKSEDRFLKLMQTFRLLIDLYEVKDYMVCATSAMREASNGQEIADKVQMLFGLSVNIISGEEEAEILARSIVPHLDENNYLHIDVGGGSTELNLYSNYQKIASKSFRIGGVRSIEHDNSEVFMMIENWIQTHTKSLKNTITAVGTGGNINKIFELSKTSKGEAMNLQRGEQIRTELLQYTPKERERLYSLNKDRADVIVPASQIYFNIMRYANIDQILVPNIGLKDGMLQILYERQNQQVISSE